jgi:hypothetical protein
VSFGEGRAKVPGHWLCILMRGLGVVQLHIYWAIEELIRSVIV